MLSMTYVQNFNRYEIKYLLTEEQKNKFIEAIGEELCRDTYASYTISNLYLDTEDFYFIEHSLEKPIYKEKLRVRSYGETDGEKEVFLEIKKKYKKTVYKRRIVLPLKEVEKYLEDGKKPEGLKGYGANQIFEEIDFLMKQYKPSPKLFLAYDREAWFLKKYPQIRITFDKNIRGRWEGLSLCEEKGAELLDTGIENYALMEIKCPQALPMEYANILSTLGIFPTSFSKYGKMYLMRKEKGGHA